MKGLADEVSQRVTLQRYQKEIDAVQAGISTDIAGIADKCVQQRQRAAEKAKLEEETKAAEARRKLEKERQRIIEAIRTRNQQRTGQPYVAPTPRRREVWPLLPLTLSSFFCDQFCCNGT